MSGSAIEKEREIGAPRGRRQAAGEPDIEGWLDRLIGEVADVIACDVEPEPVVDRRQRRVAEQGKHVEGECRLPNPSSLWQEEAQSRHELSELLGIVEVPFQIPAVKEIDGTEHLYGGPALDQLGAE